MVASGGGPAPDDGAPENSTRVLAIAAAIAAVLALVVAIGMLLRTDRDANDQTPSATPTPVSATAARTTSTQQPPWRRPISSPLPTQPAHQVGEDCSSGGITAHWDIVPGRGWVCVPQTQGDNAPAPLPAEPGGT
ncbi:hypothetical protein [Nocardia sp. NPDC050710]|uniref:hypothetical protein n=1 Tax=Nocardia sp. NPDC050710 TaxID=3157220 RepID=UPI0033F9C0D8